MGEYFKIYFLFFIILTSDCSKLEDLKDVIELTTNLETSLFGTQYITDSTKSNTVWPIIRDKQRIIIKRINSIERDLEQLTTKHSHYMSAFQDATINFVMRHSQAMMLFHNIEKTRNRIDSMYRQMKNIERYQHALEPSTIFHLCEWFISPNSNSINNLLSILHLDLVGGGHSSLHNSPLSILAKHYEVSTQR